MANANRGPAESGIYSITSPSGRVYIGSAHNIRRRWDGHRCDLRKGRHHSTVLQKTFTKYGAEGLRFEVLELCSIATLLEREQFYMDALPKALKYNVCKVAGNRTGMFHTEESKRKMSESRLGVKITGARLAALAERNRERARTPENRERMRQLKTGKTLSVETRAKISATRVGKKASSETIEKMRAATKGVPRPRSAEHSAKIGLAHRGKIISAETRAKISAAGMGRKQSPDSRARAAAASSATKNTSGFRGVSYNKQWGRWYAYATIDGKMKNLGLHPTAETAAGARAAYLESIRG